MGPLPQYCTPNHLIPIELGEEKNRASQKTQLLPY
jgi:hypothetical protein